MPGRALLFDLDNTLHDRDAGLISFVEAQFLGRDLKTQGVSKREWIARFLALDQGGKIWKDIVYEQLCQEFSLLIEPGSLLKEYDLGFADHIYPVPRLRETLQRFQDLGWKIGIVTNGRSEFQRRTIAALKIEPLLNVIVISEECGLRKPDPAIFRLALEILTCEAERSWFFGDDQIADIEGARNVGMKAVLLQDPTLLSQALEAIDE